MVATPEKAVRVVSYEDRPNHLVGLKLLLLSLERHSPDLAVDVFVPDAPCPFAAWVERFPKVTLHTDRLEGRRGYDVKPLLLQRAVTAGGGMALWLDADVIVNRSLHEVLDAVPAERLVVTEEPLAMPYQGGRTRSQAWGLTTARELPATSNTSVVRASASHLDLLTVWDQFLTHPEYQLAQTRSWADRSIHLMGDQEVLCALLESSEFGDVPVHFLKRGRDIAHCFQHHGYMFHQMVANLATGRRPALVHSHGYKPWLDGPDFRLHLDVSPYTLLAREYADQLDEPTDWMNPQTAGGRRMVRIAQGNPWTASLPLAAYLEIRDQRLLRTGVKRLLRST